MGKYLLRRFLLALPTLLIISLCTFALNQCAPGDPVWYGDSSPRQQETDETQREINYREDAQRLGFDKPAFYFTVTTAAFPAEYQQILLPDRRARLYALTAQSGNWSAVKKYESSLQHFAKATEYAFPDSMPEKLKVRIAVSELLQKDDFEKIPTALAVAKLQLDTAITAYLQNAQVFSPPLESVRLASDSLQVSTDNLLQHTLPHLHWIPAVRWNGFDNQYQNWINGFFTGQLGVSHQSKLPVWDELKSRLGLTTLINGLAVLLAFLLAIPIGVWMARRVNTWSETWVRGFLMAFYAMPVFWLGSLAIMTFATHGQGIQLVDSIDLNELEDVSSDNWEWLTKKGTRLVMPVFVLTIHIFTVLAMQMRGSILEVMHQDFIRTAKAKGLGEGRVYWVHAFRNSLLPLIANFAGIFPFVFGGSLVIEFLFNIPGMGTKTFEAFLHKDYPVLFAIVMFSAALTVLGNLIADFLLAWTDPRIRLSR